MNRSRVATAFACVALLAGCSAAARVGIGREDVLTDAQKAFTQMEINHGDMTLIGAVDRADTTYAPGQPMTLSATPSKDGYVAILRVLPNGTTTILFPNAAHPIAYVQANKTVTVPADDDKVTITAGKPGIELYEFVASTDTRSWLFGRKPAVGKDFAELGVTTHALARDITASLGIGGGRDTVAAYVTVRVR